MYPARFAAQKPPGVDYRTVALLGPQPSMANALTAPAHSAEDQRPNVDVNAITVPDREHTPTCADDQRAGDIGCSSSNRRNE